MNSKALEESKRSEQLKQNVSVGDSRKRGLDEDTDEAVRAAKEPRLQEQFVASGGEASEVNSDGWSYPQSGSRACRHQVPAPQRPPTFLMGTTALARLQASPQARPRDP